MRYSLLLLLFISYFSFAQKGGVSSNTVFRIDSLPPEGILLDDGWKWHAGDNPDFAKADFDDSKWESIDPTKDIMDLPMVNNSSISWFRLKLDLDSTLQNKTFALIIYQMGASEIYWNGELIHKFGRIGRNKSETMGYNPHGEPIYLKGTNNKQQTLIVKFGTPDIFWVKFLNTRNSTLNIRLSRIESTLENIRNGTDFNKNYSIRSQFEGIFKSGIFFLMGLMHLAFFVYYAKQKSNLYFSIYSFITLILHSSLPLYYINNVLIINNLNIIYNFIIPIAAIMILFAVQTLFKSKKGILYWITVCVFLISLPLMIRPYKWGTIVGSFLLFILVVLAVTVMSWKAKKGNILGANSILWSCISFLIFYTFFMILRNATSLQFLMFLGPHFYNIAVLSIPIAISLNLAREFAQTSLSLASKLEEVKQLSEEKQQILATQNETLEKQVEARTAELKASQNQLIQKEKLASLGELTAGIAHEIQNPLNFVNNFSELSVELIEELGLPTESSDRPDGWIPDTPFGGWGAFLADITQNLEKINLHGKRASSIVKGMLEHSRASTGVKELTDINQLADEYLRLAYSGIRAKNGDFEVTIETHFDPTLPKIKVIPQDMGRVILNLINNAFWAVKTVEKPLVTVKTEQSEQQLIIRVIDNGTGMAEEVKAKIFQPFFTTKPTGQGTGLGLSLAYDIITKGHGGTIEVQSKQGEGSEFIITLPMTTN